MLVKANIYFENCKQIAENWKKCLLPNILALPTWGQKCIVSEVQDLEKSKMYVEHPVLYCNLYLTCAYCRRRTKMLNIYLLFMISAYHSLSSSFERMTSLKMKVLALLSFTFQVSMCNDNNPETLEYHLAQCDMKGMLKYFRNERMCTQ